MASPASLEITAKWHQVACPVCWEVLVAPHIPKILDCSHRCCLVCLQRNAILEPGQQLTCPVGCGMKTMISNGVKALETDSHISNMVKELGYIQGGPKPYFVKCKEHGEELNLYCQLCNHLACQMCVSTRHTGSNHQIKTLASVSKEQRAVFESVLNDTKNEGVNCKQAIQELETLEKQIVESLASEAREIDRMVAARKAEIFQEAQALKAQLKQISNAKIEKIQQEVARFEKHTKKLKNVCHTAEEMSESPDYAYVTQHDSLMQKIKLFGVDGRNLKVDKNPHVAKFVKQTEKCHPMLGKVLKIVTSRKLKMLQEFDNFGDAHTIALSSNNLMAVCDSYYDNKQVVIYHKQNGLFEKKTTLSLQSSNPWSPSGIAACSDGTFLVARKIGIEVYSSTGDFLKMITTRSKELSEDEVDVGSVMVLSDGRILAGDTERSIITEHDSSGKLTWMLRTSIRPFYMTSIQDKQVAITDYKSNMIVVMDIKSGKEVYKKDIPLVQGVCYDEQTDSLLTVRNEGSQYQQPISRTGLVEQYCCTTGRMVARLAHGLYFPKGIALTSDGLFAVADQTTVKVYQLL